MVGEAVTTDGSGQIGDGDDDNDDEARGLCLLLLLLVLLLLVLLLLSAMSGAELEKGAERDDWVDCDTAAI